jgi:EAL domain-containing protein (putative c-di-GMP-specific phosphodiesterase class I)
VYDLDLLENGEARLYMKRVRGQTLECVLDALARGDEHFKARFARRRLLTAFVSVCRGIDYAHARGVVHRDIKPSNIMLGEFGEVHVLDWGIAAIRSAGETKEPSVVVAAAQALPGTADALEIAKTIDAGALDATHFQPIVSMHDRQVFGYEVLARSRFFGLRDPRSMFAAAKILDLEAELSRILREEGVRNGRVLPEGHALFVNTHPIEMDDVDLLLFSLQELRQLEPKRPLVLEIHESSVTKSETMQQLRSALADLNIDLAYDDFGAGQARLIELVEVPPHYLKFDMRLVQNIQTASVDRQRMLANLVQMVRELGITPLAEGIETSGDDAVCRQIGFTCAQGFFYGYPALPRTLVGPANSRDTGVPSLDETD